MAAPQLPVNSDPAFLTGGGRYHIVEREKKKEKKIRLSNTVTFGLNAPVVVMAFAQEERKRNVAPPWTLVFSWRNVNTQQVHSLPVCSVCKSNPSPTSH